MPHIRAKKFQAMEYKIEIFSEFMTKMDNLNDIQKQIQDEIQELKVKYKKKIEEQDLIIEEEDKKEVANKVNSPISEYLICSTSEEKQEQEEKRKNQPTISWGYKCPHKHQPLKSNGKPSQEQQWSCVLGLWVDWRSPLCPMYKTTMCDRGGDCHLGDRCCFAHSKSEIKDNYNFNTLIPMENYNKHKIKMEAKLKAGWDWEKELIHDRIIKN